MERISLWGEMSVIANSWLGKIFRLSDLLASCWSLTLFSVDQAKCNSVWGDSGILEPLYTTRESSQWQTQPLLLILDLSYWALKAIYKCISSHSLKCYKHSPWFLRLVKISWCIKSPVAFYAEGYKSRLNVRSWSIGQRSPKLYRSNT